MLLEFSFPTVTYGIELLLFCVAGHQLRVAKPFDMAGLLKSRFLFLIGTRPGARSHQSRFQSNLRWRRRCVPHRARVRTAEIASGAWLSARSSRSICCGVTDSS